MNSTYAWQVTFDYTESEGIGAIGVIGPKNAPDELVDNIFGGPNIGTWRCYDSDGEVWYAGVIVGDYEGFEPLDDFCGPNYGCTEIRYLDMLTESTGEWVAL